MGGVFFSKGKQFRIYKWQKGYSTHIYTQGNRHEKGGKEKTPTYHLDRKSINRTNKPLIKYTRGRISPNLEPTLK